MRTVAEALQAILETISPLPSGKIGINEGLNLILANNIVSDVDSPPFDKALMDGYAVRSEEFSQQRCVTLQVIEEVTAGNVGTKTVTAGEAVRIMTGAPIPEGANAVVPVEQSEFDSASESVRLEPSKPLSKGANILYRGVAMRVGESVLEAGRTLRPQELGVLAEMGVHEITARPQPRVSVLATGDELVTVDQIPGPGQIRNTNETMLIAQIQQSGGIPRPLGIARDNREDLSQKIQAGLKSDILLLSGGVSAGKLDLVPSELASAGVRQIFHKVSVKPGKPLWFGVLEATEPPGSRPCYVFGLPGNPVSSMVCFELFVRAAIRQLQGSPNPVPAPLKAKLGEEFSSPGDRDFYFPCRWEYDENGTVARLVNWRGSADLRSTIHANGLAVFPAEKTTFQADDIIDVIPWSSF